MERGKRLILYATNCLIVMLTFQISFAKNNDVIQVIEHSKWHFAECLVCYFFQIDLRLNWTQLCCVDWQKPKKRNNEISFNKIHTQNTKISKTTYFHAILINSIQSHIGFQLIYFIWILKVNRKKTCWAFRCICHLHKQVHFHTGSK